MQRSLKLRSKTWVLRILSWISVRSIEAITPRLDKTASASNPQVFIFDLRLLLIESLSYSLDKLGSWYCFGSDKMPA